MHLPALPVLLPFFAAILILYPWFNKRLHLQRLVAQFALLMLVAVSMLTLFKTLAEGPMGYAMGDWEAPFGIYLLADPLAAFMLVVTSVLALCTHLFACGGEDKTGRFFHPLFMFQLMGLNGAFLTADAFNLFVFFEILLIASCSALCALQPHRFCLLPYCIGLALQSFRHAEYPGYGVASDYLTRRKYSVGSGGWVTAEGCFRREGGTVTAAFLVTKNLQHNFSAGSSLVRRYD